VQYCPKRIGFSLGPILFMSTLFRSLLLILLHNIGSIKEYFDIMHLHFSICCTIAKRLFNGFAMVLQPDSIQTKP